MLLVLFGPGDHAGCQYDQATIRITRKIIAASKNEPCASGIAPANRIHANNVVHLHIRANWLANRQHSGFLQATQVTIFR